MNLLEVRNLNIEFDTPEGVVRAVNNINFDVRSGETLAIVEQLTDELAKFAEPEK